VTDREVSRTPLLTPMDESALPIVQLGAGQKGVEVRKSPAIVCLPLVFVAPTFWTLAKPGTVRVPSTE